MSKPKLALIPSGYKSGKVYSILPNDATGDFDFERQSIGTRVRKDGLIEEAKTVGSITNILQRSEEFNNSYWSKQGGCTITSNTTLAPDGTNTADTLSGATGTSVSGTVLRRNVVISGTSTLSIYVKSLGSTNFTIYIRNGGNGQVFSQSITPNNDWQRVTLTTDPANGQVFFGNTNGDVAIWGAMLSEGALSDYIKTEGSSETKTVETFTDVPRLDWLNSNCPTLLLEPQRTNYIKYSQDITQSIWNKRNVNYSSNFIDPSGKTNAFKIYPDTVNTEHYLEQTLSITTATTYTASVFLKDGGTSNFEIIIVHVGVGIAVSRALFTITNGVISFSSSTGIIQNVELKDFGNGWYRCEVKYNWTGTVTSHRLRILPRENGTYVGDNINGVYVYGMQVEQATYPTSYIKTEASTVTRLKDECINGGDSDLFDITEGTFFVDANNFGTPLNDYNMITLSDGGNNFVRFLYESSRIRTSVYNGATQQDYFITGVNDNERNKVAITFKENEFKTYFNGVLKHTDTSGVVPINFDRLNFASQSGTSRHFEGKVYDTRVYDRVLTEAEAIEITTL